MICLGIVILAFGLLGAGPASAETITDLPIFGKFDSESASMLATTIVIGFLDGLNPYSLWGMVFLLGIVMTAGSRPRAVIVGLTYLVVVGLTYGLMMVGFLNVFSRFSYQYLIQVIVGLVALVFALINIYDYFRGQDKSTLVTSKRQSRLRQRIQKVMSPTNGIGTLVTGTVVVALGMTILEFPLSFSLPLVWTNIMARYQVNLLVFLLLLLVYLLIYLFDEFIAFFSIIFALSKNKSHQDREQALKLIGGTVIFFLAIALIMDLEILNTLTGSLLLFGLALAVSFSILIIFPDRRKKLEIKDST